MRLVALMLAAGYLIRRLLVIQLIAILFFAAFVPVSGILADKFNANQRACHHQPYGCLRAVVCWRLIADIIVEADGSLNSCESCCS